MRMKALLLRDIRLADGTGCDVLVEDGRFAAFGRDLTAPSGAAVEDGAGGLLPPRRWRRRRRPCMAGRCGRC